MAEQVNDQQQSEDALPTGPALTPLQYTEGHVPGRYAAWDCSPEPIYGPDELGEYRSAIDDLSETCTRADSAARILEVMQAWEQRFFSRNYQFLVGSNRGWGMYGASASGGAQSIMQTQNAMKLFSCNVFGAREDKIVASLSREVPGLTFVPKRDSDPMDQTAADESKKYSKVWMVDSGIKDVVAQTASLFYTDERVAYYTRSVADEQRWGTETPDEQQETFDAPAPDGLTPETEMEPDSGTGEQPAVRELTTAYGKLECKVPIAADSFHAMPWVRISTEENANILKERYPWIEDKISAGGTAGGSDQIDRTARITVRLAVQSTTTSGDSMQQDATESKTWYRPSQYRAIKNKDLRNLFYETFPDGLLVVHAGSELAFIRNESMNDKLVIVHSRPGSGQNRRSIGTNYLPLQKILNANVSLLDRYFRSAVPRRFALEGPLDVQAINQQSNDPAKITPVTLTGMPPGVGLDGITSVEQVPQPNTAMFEFIQWLINGAPEAMDGASPAMFGMEDADTFGATKLNRDQALQVFSLPWSQICTGLARAAEQAASAAAENRVASIQSNVPGQGKLEVEISKLRGNALCQPESMEIPQTIAEQEAQFVELLSNAQNVSIVQAMLNDPRNLTKIAQFPSFADFELTGVDDVEQQQGEFELLLQSGPLDNPQLQQVQDLIKQADADPEAQTPQGQQMLSQLQQQAQGMPPQVSSVTVAQDGSENHAIHAAITLGLLTSPQGRKLKNGNPEQQASWQNLKLHWQEHMQMSQKLTPPKPMEFKGSVTIDPSKFPPEAQSEFFEAMGLQVAPQTLQPEQDGLTPHEVTTEKEGVDANGVPIKQKISMVNPQGKLN